jgi:peptide/nickel transport system substrate-binding protein
MHFAKRFATLITIALVVMLGVSVRSSAAQTSKPFVIGMASNAISLDPARGFEQESGIIDKAAYDTLVTFPADNVNKILPNLATSWAASSDGLTYTFTLKSGVHFSSGNAVTASDVVFSWNRMKNVKGNPSFLADTIDSVTAPDDKTVVLKLNAPDPAILAKLVFPAFSVTDSAVVKQHGGTDAVGADKSDTAETWLDNNSAGTGPYVLTKWDKHNEIDLAKNAKYDGPNKAGAFDQVISRDMPQAATQKQALETGDIDLAYDLTPDQSASVKSNPDLKLYEGPSVIVFFLIMNQDKTIGGPVSDPKVQQAIRLALDYDGLRTLTGGSAVTPASVIPVGFFAALGSDKALKQDVAGAKKLLADAGQSGGFSIDMEYWDATYQGVNIGTTAQKVQADLKAVGITVNLKGEEINVALANYRAGKSPIGLWFWGPDYIDPLDYVEFLPEGIVGKRANWTNANSDATIQKLRDQLKTETDPEKRADLFGQMQTYLQGNSPFAPFVQPGVQIGYRADLKGFAYNQQWNIDPATFSR